MRIKKLRELKSEERKRANGTTILFSQRELAEALDVSQKTVDKWEHDQVMLNSEKIVALADFFNVSTDYLLRGGNPDSLVLMNETGLPESTIQRLRIFKDSSIPTFLSKVVEHRLFFQLMQMIDHLSHPEDFNRMFTDSVIHRLTKDGVYVDSPDDFRAIYEYQTTIIFSDIVREITRKGGDNNEKSQR